MPRIAWALPAMAVLLAACGTGAPSTQAIGQPGFAIVEPVADGINNAIIGRSAVLGADLRAAFAAGRLGRYRSRKPAAGR